MPLKEPICNATYLELIHHLLAPNHLSLLVSFLLFMPLSFFLVQYFSDYKMLSPQIWEEKGCVSYSLNVAYLARCGVGWGGGGGAGSQEQDHIFCFKIFFSYFPPLKLGCVLWSGVSYSPKNMVLGSKTKSYLPFLFFSAFLHSYCPPH